MPADPRAARRALEQAKEAIQGVFFNFEPEHMDFVSGSRCGSNLYAAGRAIDAALAALPQDTETPLDYVKPLEPDGTLNVRTVEVEPPPIKWDI